MQKSWTACCTPLAGCFEGEGRRRLSPTVAAWSPRPRFQPPTSINRPPLLATNMATSMVAPADNTRLPGILRLSPDTRQRIYWHAGLGHGHRFCGEYPVWSYPAAVCYNLDGGNGPKPGWSGYYLYFHGLFLSCRAIHDEAVALLYSTNHFIIRYQPRRSLASLRALTPPALAHLATLRVVLNQVACHEQQDGYEGQGDCCMDRRWPIGGPWPVSSCPHEHHKECHDLPLAQPEGLPGGETLFNEWHTTLASLAPHITPGTLDLAIVCDVRPDDEGVASARVLLASLRVLPRLKNCHIRLCAMRHPQLEELAHEAALQARGIRTPASNTAALSPPIATGSSHLLLLPAELRLRILEYTDLITPWKEVYWSRGQRGYWTSTVPCMPLEGRGDCPPEYHHGCRFVQCAESEWPQPSIGCFCRRFHAASSSICRCWVAPTPLFLICRTLSRDACLTFYTGNRFLVVDSPSPYTPLDWWPAGAAYPHSTFAASEFLRTIVPPSCVPHLRFIELVWAPFGGADWPQAEHAALREWAETVDWMRDHLNLPGLTLRLALPTASAWGYDGQARDLSQAEGDAVLEGYQRILEPLSRLSACREDGSGLARFYAQMEWPCERSSWVKEKQLNGEVPWDWPDSEARRLKERAERFIMGARYERVCTGPGVPAESVWPYSCARHC